MRWVIQGEEIFTQDLKTLAKLGKAQSIHRVTDTAFLLLDAQPADEIPAYCYEKQLDCAFVPEEESLARFKLAIFDMDSTLIKNECIDEMADAIGIKPLISKLTERSMRGEIPFSESLLARLQALAGIDEITLQKIATTKIHLVSGAEKLIHALHYHKIETVIITGGFHQFVQHVANKLHINKFICNELELIDNKLSGNLAAPLIDGNAKATHLVRLCSELGINSNDVLAIGDGANDAELFKKAGTSIAFHAKPILRDIATHRLDFVGIDGILAIFPPTK